MGLVTNPWRPRKGELIRCGKGPTALMWYDSETKYRYYGDHVLGGVTGCNAEDARRATKEEVEKWGHR